MYHSTPGEKLKRERRASRGFIKPFLNIKCSSTSNVQTVAMLMFCTVVTLLLEQLLKILVPCHSWDTPVHLILQVKRVGTNALAV